MLVIVCADGVVRIGDGGGVTRYEHVDEIAGVEHVARVDMAADQVCAALARAGTPWWRRLLRR